MGSLASHLGFWESCCPPGREALRSLAPSRGPARGDTGIPTWDRPERQVCRGQHRGTLGGGRAGPCQVLLGTERLVSELEEDKGGKQAPREGPGVRVDHKSK